MTGDGVQITYLQRHVVAKVTMYDNNNVVVESGLGFRIYGNILQQLVVAKYVSNGNDLLLSYQAGNFQIDMSIGNDSGIATRHCRCEMR